MMNRDFGKLVGGRVECAPKVLEVGGRVLVSPRAADYRAAGWLPVVRTMPDPPEGHHVADMEYAAGADGNIVTVYGYEADKPAAKRYSKLKLYAALSAEGLWKPLMDWLGTQTVGGLDARTAFDLAQELDDTHPLFAPMLAAAKEALGVTDERAAAILTASEADA